MIPASRLVDICDAARDAIVGYYETDDTVEDYERLPEKRVMTAGPAAWDGPCLAVWVEGTNGTAAGDPTIAVAGAVSNTPAFAMRAATLVTSIVRTAATPDQKGRGPTIIDERRAAEMIYRDHVRMLNALVRAHKTGQFGPCKSVAFSNWDVVGPDGGLVAGELRVLVGLLEA